MSGAFTHKARFQMYLLLLLLWLIFNGRFTLEVLIIGMIVCLFIYVFMCVFMGFSPKKELKNLWHIPYMIKYLFTLISEIIKANFAVIRFIYDARIEVEPEIVHFKHKFKDYTHNQILANSITLTPGTITVEIDDDEFIVHCLDRDLAEGLDSSSFVKQLDVIEKKDKR